MKRAKSILLYIFCAIALFAFVACGTQEAPLPELEYSPTEQELEEIDLGEPTPEPEYTLDDVEIIPPATTLADTPHGQIAVAHIEYMSDNFYSRVPFSYQEKRTALWIVEELLAMGYDEYAIEMQTFRSRWDQGDMFGAGVEMRDPPYSQNVILTVPGQSDYVIVVGAHYDSLAYPGASDNASGTALLLESAYRMRYIDNYYTIVYVFFGAEEVGLIGAFYYVDALTEQEHDNILFMLNADVLIEGPYLFYMAGYNADWQPGVNHITETWDEIAQDMYNRHGITLFAWPDGAFGPSDQLAFLHAGHTVMFLAGLDLIDGWYDRDFSSALWEMMRVLHSPRDEFHYINERWPRKIDDNMWAFSLLLEALLLASYT